MCAPFLRTESGLKRFRDILERNDNDFKKALGDLPRNDLSQFRILRHHNRQVVSWLMLFEREREGGVFKARALMKDGPLCSSRNIHWAGGFYYRVLNCSSSCSAAASHFRHMHLSATDLQRLKHCSILFSPGNQPHAWQA